MSETKKNSKMSVANKDYLQCLVERLRDYDNCNDDDIDEAASIIERLRDVVKDVRHSLFPHDDVAILLMKVKVAVVVALAVAAVFTACQSSEEWKRYDAFITRCALRADSLDIDDKHSSSDYWQCIHAYYQKLVRLPSVYYTGYDTSDFESRFDATLSEKRTIPELDLVELIELLEDQTIEGTFAEFASLVGHYKHQNHPELTPRGWGGFRSPRVPK